MNRNIGRRKFLAGTLVGALAAGAALSTPYIRRVNGNREKRLIISGWGGSTQRAMRQAYFDPFTQETGIEVKEVTYGGQGLARLKTQMLEGGPQVDLLDGAPFWPTVGVKEGLLEKIALSDVDKSKFLPGALTDYSFGYATVSWGITYNTQKNSQPQNWSDFWDTVKFPGRRAMFGPFVARHPEYALMAAGISPHDVYPFGAAKLDRAFEKLEQIKPFIDVWYQTGAQCEQLLIGDQVDYAEFFNGRAYLLRDEGYPIDYVWNQAVMNVLPFLLAKNAPNTENALRFLAYIARPEPQAEFARIMYYGPTNQDALSLLNDQKVLVRLPTYAPNLEQQVVLDADWWGQHLEPMAARWNRLISA